MEIAYAQRNITPPPGEEMGGYGYYINRRAKGTLDPLLARVCGFRDGERTALLVQLDLAGLQADHVEELRGRIQRLHGVAPDAVLFHCTHTHTGPASLTWFGPGELTQTLRGMLTKSILQTVADAMAAWRLVTRARWFDHDGPGISFNRDDIAGPVDSHVRGLLFEVAGAVPVSILSYACHPVVMGVRHEYSADYPGAVAQRLAARGIRGVFLTAPCGDLDPVINRVAWGTGTDAVCHLYAQQIIEAAMQGLESGVEIDLSSGVRTGSRQLGLAVVPPGRDDCQRAIDKALQQLEQDPTHGPSLSELNGNRNWLRMLDSGQPGDRQPIEVQAIAVGNSLIAGVGAELFSELGTMIRQHVRQPALVLAGTSNAVRCYIGTRRSIEAERYSRRSACFYGVFPQHRDGGEQLAQDAAAFLNESV